MDVKKDFLMVSNRGPNFISCGKVHKGIGGTKDAYISIMENFCDKWLCLASEDLMSENIESVYGDSLDICFIRDDIYKQYYYKYISEFLYPTLLGHSEKAISRDAYLEFEQVSIKIAENINEKYQKKDLIICDYHLFKIPELVDSSVRKIFFWFIPFLDIKQHTKIFKEIVQALSKTDEIYFLNSVYAENFISAYRFYFKGMKLKSRVRVATLGPSDFYKKQSVVSRCKYSYEEILCKYFGVKCLGNKKFILSVSRMDFVKNIPVLIAGFEQYLKDNSCDSNTCLLIIAHHHRRQSPLYKKEESRILNMIYGSRFKDRIFLTSQVLVKYELKVLYENVDIFACTSVFDGMPLTPLEYVLSNNGNGAVILSNTVGAFELLKPNVFEYYNNNYFLLSESISKLLYQSMLSKKEKMELMKESVSQVVLSKWIEKVSLYLNKYKSYE